MNMSLGLQDLGSHHHGAERDTPEKARDSSCKPHSRKCETFYSTSRVSNSARDLRLA
jgi:hypothetical protein